MTERGNIVRFDEILKRTERKLVIDDTKTYRCVGVRWYGQGTFIREQLPGIDISRKEQWRIEPGDIVYNKLFAWKGAFAVADKTVSGCIVSDKFPTYHADAGQLDLGWLKWYFRTADVACQAQRLSKGAAAISKLTLNPPDFWKLTIPLPSLTEQRRMLVRLESIACKLEEVRAIRPTAQVQAAAIVRSKLNQIASSLVPVAGTLAEVLKEPPRNGWSVRCDDAEGGTPVLKLSAVTGFKYNAKAIKRTSQPVEPNRHYWLEPDDLLITRSNTPELVGHAAIYDGHPAPCIYPDLMMRCRFRPEKADTRFVHFWLQTSLAREHIQRRAKGTSPTMKKIAQADVEGIPFPTTLPLDAQHCIVEELRELECKVDSLKRLQAETAAELDAMLPSILDKVFKGEL